MPPRIISLILCSALCGCARQNVEMRWTRADGNQTALAQLDAARTACIKEIENAEALKSPVRADDLFRNCMARYGFIQTIDK
jgi:hypothetical protein